MNANYEEKIKRLEHYISSLEKQAGLQTELIKELKDIIKQKDNKIGQLKGANNG